MLFSWLKRRRREKLLAEPIPAEWLAVFGSNVTFFPRLSADEQARLRDLTRVFVAEKNWEGCNGLVVTDAMRVTIAAYACLLILNMEPRDYYASVLSVLIYPATYAAPDRLHQEQFTIEGVTHRFGEAWYRGPVILSWAEVLHDCRHPGEGRNLVWHEFSHQLDMLDRGVDGTPPLGDRQAVQRWREVMTAEYEQLIEDAEAGRATLLDEYGASSEAEFFAVATECFFDLPHDLQEYHPRLYELLRDYYRQDPVHWAHRR